MSPARPGGDYGIGPAGELGSRPLTRAALALALFIAAFVLVLGSQAEQGIARDEVVYMNAGKKYAAWWIGLVSGKDGMVRAETITAHFGGKGATDNNREHPPLMKTLFGLSHALVHDHLGWTGELTAYRLPSALMHGLLVALVFLFAGSRWGQTAGFLAALFTLFLPRLLFHAGLACFDAPMVTMWLATLVAYHKALGSRGWCLGLGLIFGLALATKHNGTMLPLIIGAHYLWLSVRAARVGAGWPDRGISGRLGLVLRAMWTTRPLIIAALAVIGPLTLIAVWPWLWLDTAAHLAAWMRFHLTHVHYNFEYLGHNLNSSPYPWHVPVVSTILTVPVVTLVAAGIGAAVLARQAWCERGREAAAGTRDRAPMVLLALSLAVAMAPFLTGRAPIFGATKHFAPALLTLCVLAGIGVDRAVRLAIERLVVARLLSSDHERRFTGLALAVLGGLAVAAAATETFAAHPYALSHYNALAGGAPGGADLGMNRQFWGYAARGVLPFVNQHAPGPGEPARPVYTHDASPAWGMYRSLGWLAPRLPDAGHEAGGVARSKLAIVIHERHFARHDYLIWSSYGTVRPAYVLTLQGVPLVSVYVRPSKPE